MSKKSNTKSIVIWTVFIGAVLLMLWGLAKIGSTGTGPVSNGPGTGGTLSAELNEKDQTKGASDPAVKLVEYSDFQCPACQSYYPMLKQLLQEFPSDLSVTYRHFPLRTHTNARQAARAAEAAGKQGKFWEMHDFIFNTLNKWQGEINPEPFFITLAESVGINPEQFKEDMKSEEIKQKVQDDYDSGISSGVQGTPTFYLNGTQIDNPRNYDEFKLIIAEIIKNT